MDEEQGCDSHYKDENFDSCYKSDTLNIKQLILLYPAVFAEVGEDSDSHTKFINSIVLRLSAYCTDVTCDDWNGSSFSVSTNFWLKLFSQPQFDPLKELKKHFLRDLADILQIQQGDDVTIETTSDQLCGVADSKVSPIISVQPESDTNVTGDIKPDITANHCLTERYTGNNSVGVQHLSLALLDTAGTSIKSEDTADLLNTNMVVVKGEIVDPGYDVANSAGAVAAETDWKPSPVTTQEVSSVAMDVNESATPVNSAAAELPSLEDDVASVVSEAVSVGSVEEPVDCELDPLCVSKQLHSLNCELQKDVIGCKKEGECNVEMSWQLDEETMAFGSEETTAVTAEKGSGSNHKYFYCCGCEEVHQKDTHNRFCCIVNESSCVYRYTSCSKTSLLNHQIDFHTGVNCTHTFNELTNYRVKSGNDHSPNNLPNQSSSRVKTTSKGSAEVGIKELPVPSLGVTKLNAEKIIMQRLEDAGVPFRYEQGVRVYTADVVSSGGLYTCPVCTSSFCTKREILVHTKSKHFGKHYKIDIVNSLYGSCKCGLPQCSCKTEESSSTHAKRSRKHRSPATVNKLMLLCPFCDYLEEGHDAEALAPHLASHGDTCLICKEPLQAGHVYGHSYNQLSDKYCIVCSRDSNPVFEVHKISFSESLVGQSSLQDTGEASKERGSLDSGSDSEETNKTVRLTHDFFQSCVAGGSFQCYYCTFSCELSEDLDIHVESSHVDKHCYSCRLCSSFKVSRRAPWTHHMISVHDVCTHMLEPSRSCQPTHAYHILYLAKNRKNSACDQCVRSSAGRISKSQTPKKRKGGEPIIKIKRARHNVETRVVTDKFQQSRELEECTDNEASVSLEDEESSSLCGSSLHSSTDEDSESEYSNTTEADDDDEDYTPDMKPKSLRRFPRRGRPSKGQLRKQNEDYTPDMKSKSPRGVPRRGCPSKVQLLQQNEDYTADIKPKSNHKTPTLIVEHPTGHPSTTQSRQPTVSTVCKSDNVHPFTIVAPMKCVPQQALPAKVSTSAPHKFPILPNNVEGIVYRLGENLNEPPIKVVYSSASGTSSSQHPEQSVSKKADKKPVMKKIIALKDNRVVTILHNESTNHTNPLRSKDNPLILLPHTSASVQRTTTFTQHTTTAAVGSKPMWRTALKVNSGANKQIMCEDFTYTTAASAASHSLKPITVVKLPNRTVVPTAPACSTGAPLLVTPSMIYTMPLAITPMNSAKDLPQRVLTFSHGSGSSIATNSVNTVTKLPLTVTTVSQNSSHKTTAPLQASGVTLPQQVVTALLTTSKPLAAAPPQNANNGPRTVRLVTPSKSAPEFVAVQLSTSRPSAVASSSSTVQGVWYSVACKRCKNVTEGDDVKAVISAHKQVCPEKKRLSSVKNAASKKV